MAWSEPPGAVPMVVTLGAPGGSVGSDAGRDIAVIAWYDTPGTCVALVSATASSTRPGPGAADLGASLSPGSLERGRRPWDSSPLPSASSQPSRFPWSWSGEDVLYLHWLESDARLAFTLDLGTAWPAAMPQASAIPVRKAAEKEWYYPVMPTGGLNSGSLPAMSKAYFVTRYVHPSVVPLPSGWLLILGRVRVPHERDQSASITQIADHIAAMSVTRALYDTGTEVVPVPVGHACPLRLIVGVRRS